MVFGIFARWKRCLAFGFVVIASGSFEAPAAAQSQISVSEKQRHILHSSTLDARQKSAAGPAIAANPAIAASANGAPSSPSGAPDSPGRTIEKDGTIVVRLADGSHLHHPPGEKSYVIAPDGKRRPYIGPMHTEMQVPTLDPPSTTGFNTTTWLQHHSEALLAAITEVAEGDRNALKTSYLKREETLQRKTVYQRIDGRTSDLARLLSLRSVGP